MASRTIESKYATLFNVLDVDSNGVLEESDGKALAERLISAHGGQGDKADSVRGSMSAWWNTLSAEMGGGGPFSQEQLASALETIATDEQRFDALVRPISDSVFRLYDTNGDGRISFEEFRRAEVAMGVSASDAEALFRRLDLDGNGTLSPDEVAGAVHGYYVDPSPDSPGAAFFGSH